MIIDLSDHKDLFSVILTGDSIKLYGDINMYNILCDKSTYTVWIQWY